MSDRARESVRQAVEFRRLLHELNPEQDRDYLVRCVIGVDGSRCGVEVSFNVRVRTRAAP